MADAARPKRRGGNLAGLAKTERLMTRSARRGRKIHNAPRKSGGPVYFLLVVLLLLVAGALYVGVNVVGAITRTITTVIKTPPPVTGSPQPTPAPLDPINILLIGVDRRDDDPHTLNDVNILVHVDPQRRFASMLSITRETRDYIPE